MVLRKLKINEEIDRMRVLAGMPAEQPMLEEGFLSNIAGAFGITLASLTGVFAQTGNLEKLNYSKDKISALENAMKDPAVVNKLHQLGVDDNNIQREIELIKGRNVTGYQEKTVSSESQLKTLIKAGWHLTYAQSDTILNKLKTEHPDVNMDTIFFNLNEGTMFESGKFILDETDKRNILAILDSITKSESNLIGVTIISSTDKQGLTPALKTTLSSLGYSPDNKGLSSARNNGVAGVLSSIGVDSSIINQEALFERGGPVIDQGARYVKIAFEVVKYPVPAALPQKTQDIKLKSTYELFKPMIQYGTIDIKKYNVKICRTKIQTHQKKASALKCVFQQ